MGFTPISIDEYVEKHLKSNPSAKESDLRKQLKSALDSYFNGIKCSCGNDIWVIGSASVGNSCFTCITGEGYPKDDYEIDLAIRKRENKKGRRHIDTMDPTKIAGFFDDDGYEVNLALVKKLPLCLVCLNEDNPDEDLLCQMTRFDQADEADFKCFAFIKK